MCGHVTSAGPSTQQDWFLRTLTDRAGAGQSPVGGAPAGAGGAKARERECACASGGAFSGAVGGSGSASPEVSGAGQSLGWRVLGSGGGWLGDSPAPGALHWGGCRANSFASLGASVSLFPPSGTFLHPPRGCTGGGLPTWPPCLRLCFPPRRDVATGPLLRGRARETPRSWTRAGKKVASMLRGPVAWENEMGKT